MTNQPTERSPQACLSDDDDEGGEQRRAEVERHDHDDNDDGDDEEEEEMNYGEVLDRNHLDIVKHLDFERLFVLSYLRSNSVLDEEDCEMIRNTGSTRQQKVSIFLDIIKRKGDSGIQHFFTALEFEHPGLYEKCTGKKATVATVPLPHCQNGTWNWFDGGLVGKEYIDFDRAILSKQLEQTGKDFHRMTRHLYKVQEEKNILEKKYMEATEKIKLQEGYIEELKATIERISEIKSIPENENSEHEAFATQQYFAAAQHELSQKTNLLIGLQAKLLAQTEEIAKIKEENHELRDSNETLRKEVNDLAVICDKEKRTSKRLNEQVLNQHGEIKQVENYKIHNRELRYKIARLGEEKKALQAEYDEFRKVSEVLNAKYTLINREKRELKEHREEISTSYQSAQEQVNDLNVKLSNLSCDYECVRRTNERLRSDVKTYYELQKTLREEREQLRVECLEAWKGVEKANAEMMNSKRHHDESIHNQMIINFSLDSKYREVSEELEDVRLVLKQTNEELVKTKKMLGLSRSSGSFSSLISGELSSPTLQSPTKSSSDVDTSREEQKLNSSSSPQLKSKESLKKQSESNQASNDEDPDDGAPEKRKLKRSPKPIRKKVQLSEKNEKKRLMNEKSSSVDETSSRKTSKPGDINPKSKTMKARSSKDLLDSIRRKVSEDDSEPYAVDTAQSITQKGLLSYDQLRWMYNSNFPSDMNVTGSLPPYLSGRGFFSLPKGLGFEKRGSIPSAQSVFRNPAGSVVSSTTASLTVTTTKSTNSVKESNKKDNLALSFEDYRRAASVDGGNNKKKLSSVDRELSNDSVFEHPVSPLPRSSSATPSRSKDETDFTSIEDNENSNQATFRKRSVLLDPKDVSFLVNRRRSTSAPPSPMFNMSAGLSPR